MFRVVVGEGPETVGAQELLLVEHRSQYPPELRFSSGRASRKLLRRWRNSGYFAVLVDSFAVTEGRL
jgi:hypothetical protein